jgi:hypothetical protein
MGAATRARRECDQAEPVEAVQLSSDRSIVRLNDRNELSVARSYRGARGKLAQLFEPAYGEVDIGRRSPAIPPEPTGPAEFFETIPPLCACADVPMSKWRTVRRTANFLADGVQKGVVLRPRAFSEAGWVISICSIRTLRKGAGHRALGIAQPVADLRRPLLTTRSTSVRAHPAPRRSIAMANAASCCLAQPMLSSRRCAVHGFTVPGGRPSASATARVDSRSATRSRLMGDPNSGSARRSGVPDEGARGTRAGSRLCSRPEVKGPIATASTTTKRTSHD